MFQKNIIPNKKIEKTKKKLPWVLIFFGLLGLACSIFVFGFYGITFFDYRITADTEHFGQFGDFIGGTLNPILAFLSFMALLYTIKIQMDELKLSREEVEATREELKESRIAQQEQSKSLKLQNKATTLQMFENTFFKLFEQHNEMLDNCYNPSGKISILNYYSERSNDVGQNLEDVNKNELIDNFRHTNENDTNIKNYFMILYQLLKFIDIQCTKNNFDSKLYVNMVRALLNDEILKALAVNIIAYKDYFTKYKEYVEKYELFEHLYINEKEAKFNVLFDVLIDYRKEAFGKNIYILKKYNELKNKN
ncbi:MAG: putative phage abortive infection protein [Arcobacter sp.]|uniref:putative phage abortive infection protein n=1 Tax=Arcobacter sp. TaxID=1872629 RepID=UPI003C70A2C3